MKKKLPGIILILAIFANFFSGIKPVKGAVVTNYPVRVINVVYDDSGSMIKTGGKYVDTWCQAKYSLEVFAAFLGEKDSLNVYYMSEFEEKNGEIPKLALNGKDGAEKNVAKVHETVSKAHNTWFDSVQKAYEDLVNCSADEKWLVVLTDGVFQHTPDGGIDKFFDSKKADINVMFLGMGAEAQSIKANAAKNIYFEKAETTSDILKKITDICTRVFNMNRLEVNLADQSVSFDVPMSELILFAQGGSVRVNGIKNGQNMSVKGISDPVKVCYSESAATNNSGDYAESKIKIDRNLIGEILTCRGDFDSGTYKLDVTGAETIEVYYKPNVSVAAFLNTLNGETLEAGQNIEAGEYIVTFGLVKAGTNTPVPESKLLGNITYDASIAMNGVYDGLSYTSGDKLTLNDGTLDIDVVASYLDYNTVSTHLSYMIYSNKSFDIDVVQQPEYIIEGMGITNSDEPVVVKISGKDEPLTEEQWDIIDNVSAFFQDNRYASAFPVKIVKDSKVGYFNIYPDINIDNLTDSEYTQSNLNVNMSVTSGKETWSGFGSAEVKFIDKRFKDLIFTVIDAPKYTVSTDGIDSDNKPIVLECHIEGEEWTPEKWDAVEINDAELLQESDERISVVTEKTDEPGIIKVYPQIEGKLTEEDYDDVKITIGGNGKYGVEQWQGEDEKSIAIEDSRNWLEKYKSKIIKLTLLGLLLLLILGYIPPFKKYLPKRLKPRPRIDCKPQRAGTRPSTATGKFTKRRATTLIPYVAEKGTIRFVPTDVIGVPPLQVKAVSAKNKMLVLNTKSYASNKDVSIAGRELTGKKTEISAGCLLTYKGGDMNYICNPSNK